MTKILNTESVERRLSNAVYTALVASLYSQNATMLLGTASVAIAMALTAWESGQPAFYVLAILQVLSAGLRAGIAHWQSREDVAQWSRRTALKWENYYLVGAVSHTLLMGIWCFIAFANTDSQFAQIASVTATLANMLGIAGRNYPISRLVDLQIASVGFPMLLGFLMDGGYSAIFAFLLAPYVYAIKSIATRQRNTLLNALSGQLDAQKVAEQFTGALDNMPHGLFMFSRSGVLEVVNGQAAALLRREKKQLNRMTGERIVELFVRDRGVDKETGEKLRNALYSSKKPQVSFKMKCGVNDRRDLRVTRSRIGTGGTIVMFEDITDETAARDTIDYMKKYDRLTGLPNREQMTHVVQDMLTGGWEGETSAVLMVDLDGFEKINDALGHRGGDGVLKKVAGQLQEIAGMSSQVARFGGDKFGVILCAADCRDLAVNLADRIIETLCGHIVSHGESLRIACSIGIAFSSSETRSADALIKEADLALLSAKKQGKGSWVIYDEDMGQQMQARRELENDLRFAVERGELSAFFQPLVNIGEGRISTCEALLRWKHPKHGFVPPPAFIPLAEETGLIKPIGDWMLKRACAACASWPEGTRVAVNLSPVQFRGEGLEDSVREALAESGLAPDRLELEITESLLMDDMTAATRMLENCKRLGVRVSLDDFGTGYSSLSYLNSLPFDKVKIDRAFVRFLEENTKSLVLVRGVARLGSELGLAVVVEGVETEKQMEILLWNAPIDEIQGYLFSKPVDEAEIYEIVHKLPENMRKIVKRAQARLKRSDLKKVA